MRFTAQNGTVYTEEALSVHNTYSLGQQRLEVPVLANTFTDTHFDNPDRQGLLTFGPSVSRLEHACHGHCVRRIHRGVHR